MVALSFAQTGPLNDAFRPGGGGQQGIDHETGGPFQEVSIRSGHLERGPQGTMYSRSFSSGGLRY